MSQTTTTLRDLSIGETVQITTVGGDGALRQHFLDMGVIPGAMITLVKLAPMGDPMEFSLHDYELTLRKEDAAKIDVKKLTACGGNCAECLSNAACASPVSTPAGQKSKDIADHPYLGEPGIHHDGSTPAFGDDHVLTFALVGNQNSGKTTLFNRLTGANQHVGNFPGVTVDRKDGAILSHKNTRITDLPGIYSMSPYSSEELVSRNFVLNEHPDAIINIVDATNIERNIYLTMQLLEMDIPVVVALNMMDELTGNGGAIDVNRMEAMLGVPVVPISAAKNQGIEELVSHALHIAKYQEKPIPQDFCAKDGPGAEVHRCLHAAAHLIEDHAHEAGIPIRFAAAKAIEGDELILNKLNLDTNERETLEHIAVQMESERGLDRSAAIADMRYAYIFRVCSECVKKPHESTERLRSERIDWILTGKYTAIPIFIAIMALIFYLTFNVIGAWLQDLIASGVESLTEVADTALTNAGANDFVHSLIIGGVFEGVGSVLSFIPIVVTMFFFLSLLEDSGYTARVAFFMDKLLRKIGLSGRSIVPMLMGFGCTVPAVMATRTLPSERDRKMTILLTPFMSCTAKLPIYAFFVSAFFPSRGGLIMTGLYVLGIVMAVLIALLYKKVLFRGEAVPFVMELPNYRFPRLVNTLRLVWDKAKDFLQRAFTIILVASIVVWLLQSLDFRFNLVEDSSQSIMAALAGFLAPLFKPLGLADWRVVTSLISGFMAKESVVSVLEVLFGSEGGVTAVLTTVQVGALLIFCLLYTPCVAAIAAVRRELGRKWSLYVVFFQCFIAWLCAFVFTILANLIF